MVSMAHAETFITMETTKPVNGTTTVKPNGVSVSMNSYEDNKSKTAERKAEVKRRIEAYKKMTPEQKREYRARWQKDYDLRKQQFPKSKISISQKNKKDYSKKGE